MTPSGQASIPQRRIGGRELIPLPDAEYEVAFAGYLTSSLDDLKHAREWHSEQAARWRRKAERSRRLEGGIWILLTAFWIVLFGGPLTFAVRTIWPFEMAWGGAFAYFLAMTTIVLVMTTCWLLSKSTPLQRVVRLIAGDPGPAWEYVVNHREMATELLYLDASPQARAVYLRDRR